MILSLVKVAEKNTESLLNSLKELASIDADFIGQNGTESNWEKTIEKGYSSNLEFCLDTIKDFPEDKAMIEVFVASWIENTPNYKDYKLEVIYDEDCKAECIAVAIIN